MGKMPIARSIAKDEPALRLAELNQMKSDSTGVHRYQLIYVMRKQEVAVYREDMGPSEGYTALEFEIWSGWQDSVAYLRDMARKQRHSTLSPPERYLQSIEDSTLIEDYIAMVEQRQKVARNQSHSGPGGLIQRTGFHPDRKDS